MIVNDVYVRVLWVSEAQLEELYVYIHQRYKIAFRNTKLTILEPSGPRPGRPV